MVQCPKCSAQNLPESRFCSSCAQPLSAHSQMPTAMGMAAEPPNAQAETPHVSRVISSDSIPAGGFTPGTVLADRYRIIGLLGRGGMGEVYRADDLKLGQAVALKFLPPKLAEDPVRRERFFAEVRITRQLSHPNICRVYDIGEIEGKHFLSMEFIDGEDLASLIKRIGHLTNEKALDIARQVVAGLAAAHDRGVLHRDLKPANIMLDGHGRVRITDFGLAIAAEDEAQAAEIAGTPAYMAPEQLAGKGATVRSDIYSLGLVLYEIYTGRKAFAATTLAELREQKETQIPRAPSEIREGIDPVVERLVRRCMERDPNARPASVSQLAIALPGADPLTAALAAGETPSPEMVAASGGKEGLRPAVAWSILAFIILGMVAMLAMNDRAVLHRRVPFEKHPQFLIERSREILKKAGYTDEPADSDYGFYKNSDLLRYFEKLDNTANRWKKLGANAILFWYRQSPRLLEAPAVSYQGFGIITPDNPPLQFPGEALVMLNTQGHLVSFHVIPPEQIPSSGELPPAPDWKVLFAETGMDSRQWTAASPEWNPQSYADTRAAWRGSIPNYPDIPMRIEAAAFQGRPVSFELKGPVGAGTRMEISQLRGIVRDTIVWIVVTLAALIAGGIFFARRNLRLGRGDRRNAIRLALMGSSVMMLCLILYAHNNLSLWELILISVYGSVSLALGALLWILYIAIEPFVRRRWPQMLVSWTRLISGDWNDAGVARDLLVGSALGVLITSITLLGYYILPSRLGYAELDWPYEITFSTFLGGRFVIARLLQGLAGSISLGFAIASILFFLRILLRSQKAAGVVLVLLLTWSSNPWIWTTNLVAMAIGVFCLVRFGLVATIIGILIGQIVELPATLDASAWYAAYGYAALAVFAALILNAFRTSLVSRPNLAPSRLDD
jgi:hypothetical protein